MIRICRQNKQSVLEKIRNGQLDAAALSQSNLVDDIIIAMHRNHLLYCLEDGIDDKRARNLSIPFRLIMASAIAAKMKIKTSLTDIQYAIDDHRTLSEIGYNIVDYDGNLSSGFMTEGSLRNLFGKYKAKETISYYNKTVQENMLPKLNISSDIHILDCTELEVNYSNKNYEESGVAKDDDGKNIRGYKLATIRGVVGDTGIIENIRLGAINVHDFRSCSHRMKALRKNDILTS